MNKDYTTSGSYYPGEEDDGTLLTDGGCAITETPFETVAFQGTNAVNTITVDLTENATINKIVVGGVIIAGNRQYGTVTLKVSENGVDFTEVTGYAVTEEATDGTAVNYSYDLAEAVTGQYVQITVVQTAYVFGLGEIEVYGKISYTYGENLTWNYTDNILTISGEGEMTNYNSTKAPWYSYRSEIKSVIISNSVTSIGNHAFYNCYALSSITIPDSVTSIGRHAFRNCTSLTSVTIPDSVTTIGDYAFYDCSNLTSITIPDSVTTVGDYAFSGCDSLTTISIGSAVTTIGNNAFYSCLSLEEINVSFDNATYSSRNGILFNKNETLLITYPAGKKDKSYAIPNNVTRIENYAFESNTLLEMIIFGSSVTSIGSHAFSKCYALEEVHITNITSWCDISFSNCFSTPLYYAENLYLNEALITNLVLPTSVTSVGNYAFYNCTAIKTVIIPNSATYIGYSAFEDCSALETVIIPETVTYIGYGAFSGCAENFAIIAQPDSRAESYANNYRHHLISEKCGENATAEFNNGTLTINGSGSMYFSVYKDLPIIIGVIVNDGITSIGMEDFYGCTSLETIMIPKSVTNIGASAFGSCNNLKSIYYAGTEEEWNAITIGLYNEALLNATVYFGTTTGITVKDDKYTVENGIISGISEFTKVSSLSDVLSNSEYTVTNANGNVLDKDALIGTGCTITTPFGDSVTVVIKGDTDGNGEIDATDYAKIKSAFLTSTYFDDAYMSAADTNNDGEVDATDYARIKSHFLGKVNIFA